MILLVKHALPTLVAGVAARHWLLGAEGEAQSRRLAARLRAFAPFELVCSHEPKARRTAEIVGAELGITPLVLAGLEELDRPALPLLSAAEHAALNAPIFSEPSRRVVGRESGVEALQRFNSALSAALAGAPQNQAFVVVTHGTVIALLVSAHNDTDAFQLWRTLQCGSFVVLAAPGFKLRGVEHVD